MSPMLHNREIGSRFFSLFVGPHGSGKTVAVGSMPGPMLIFDFDDKVDSIIKFFPNRTDIEYHTVGLTSRSRGSVINIDTFLEKLERLQDRCDYATVSIDSYTMYSTVAVLAQMGAREEKDLKHTKGGFAIPDWDEFKGETGVAVHIMEIVKTLPCHFIMTAHPVSKAQTTKQGGSTNDVLASMVRASTLATYGWKTVSILPSYFSEMYYFHSDPSSQLGQGSKYYVQTVSQGEIVAKTALPLPNSFEITGTPFWPIVQKCIADYKEQLEERRRARAAAQDTIISGPA